MGELQDLRTHFNKFSLHFNQQQLKLKIALYANVTDGFVGQNLAYMNYFGQFGEVILVTSESDLTRILETCDILALPGGADVSPLTYKSLPGFFSNRNNPHYEHLDKYLLDPWLLTNKPIIGICRGLQVLNVHMGGTLHPHINGHVQDDKSRSDTPEIMYCNIPKVPHRYPINSFHHQGIARLAEGFDVLGWGDLYKGCPSLRNEKNIHWNTRYTIVDKKLTEVHDMPMVIELIVHNTKPYVACQYHPEDTMDELFTNLIQVHIIERLTKNANTKEANKNKNS